LNGPLPIFYSFVRCPYAMRARMALLVSGICVNLREVALRNKPDAMVLASTKATVPVLVLPDGHVIDESLAIMRWALALNDPERWLDMGGDDVVVAIDGAFKHHLDRMKYHTRYPGTDPLEHRHAAIALLEPLEARLAGARNLFGDRPTLADIAIFPFIRQFARADNAAWANEPLPQLRGWLDRLCTSPLFTAAMAKYPRWTPGDEDLPFPPPRCKDAA
jgi:glutathione S-transferase